MNMDKDQVLREMKTLVENLIHYTETAQVGPLLGCYSASPDFLAVSPDGVIRNYTEFAKTCQDYYESLMQQKLTTNHHIFHVLDDTTVLWCWSGNIDAAFKNGDAWSMQHYTVTFLFKKTNGEWKVIHSHESGLAPQIIPSK